MLFSTVLYPIKKTSKKPSQLSEFPIWLHICSSVSKQKNIYSYAKVFFNSKQKPVTTRNNETFHLFCCLCCPSELLETIAKIPRSGYLPHQTIDLHIHVNNRTNKTVSELLVELIQVT